MACAAREVSVREHETTRLELVMAAAVLQEFELALPSGDQSSHGRLRVFDAKGEVCADVVVSERELGRLVAQLALAPGTYRAEVKTVAGSSASVPFTVAPGDAQPTLRILLH